MSTSGAIAIRQGDGWTGVYNHWDSYPTGLGKELWDYLENQIMDIQEFAAQLLNYDDWRNFRDGGRCSYCGKVGLGQPHSIGGDTVYKAEFKTKAQMRRYFQSLPAWQGRNAEIKEMIDREWQIRDNIKRTGHPDPEALHHQHGDLTDKVTNENADPLFIEWVYVIDPRRMVLEVLASRRVKGTHTESSESGGYHEWQNPNYEHCLLATYPLNCDEPNWKELEDKADQIGDIAYELFSGKGGD